MELYQQVHLVWEDTVFYSEDHTCLYLKGKAVKTLAKQTGAGGPYIHLLLKIKPLL